MAGPQGGERRRTRITKEDAGKARAKLSNITKDLDKLEADELVVLLHEVSAEITSRGGSDLLPHGLHHRLSRVVE